MHLTALPSAVWRLTVAYSMMMAGTSLMVLLAGIIGTEFAPSAGLATLPIALVVLGLAAASLSLESFGGFCMAAVLMGWAGAAGHQYRFAALEAVPAELAPRATSVLLFGGILAAFIGPEIAVRGRGLLPTE